MLEWLDQIDRQLFLALNGWGGSFLDIVMIGLSDKWIWLPLYAFLIYYLYRQHKWHFYIPLAALILILIFTDQFTSGWMKPFFERARPCHNPEFSHLVKTFGHCGGQFGFASSHAANTFGMATFFFLNYKHTRMGTLLLVWAGLVSYSRVYLGVHYPGDIIAGALVGVLFAWIVSHLTGRWFSDSKKVNPTEK